MSDGAIHFSRLRLMAKSPAHYKAADEFPREDTLAMRIGRLIHAMVLGGTYHVWDGTRRGKAWDEFEVAHLGEEIVTRSEVETAEPVAAAVIAHFGASALLDGDRERRVEWALAGRSCAGRLDVLGAGFITDLKTTTNAEPGWFTRHAIGMGYHAQLAWYRDGVEAAGLPMPERVYVVAVETKPPYVVTPLELTDRAIDMGRRTYRLWFERLLVCEKSDFWPGYVQGVAPFDVPEDEALFIDGEEVAA